MNRRFSKRRTTRRKTTRRRTTRIRVTKRKQKGGMEKKSGMKKKSGMFSWRDQGEQFRDDEVYSQSFYLKMKFHNYQFFDLIEQ